VDNQHQALQNSGNVRLVTRLQPGLRLSGLYEGPDVLFTQVARLQGAYPVVVNGLLPAQLQAEYSQLRGYAGNKDVPVLRDDGDLSQAIARIRARRVELLDLARSEAAFATARWYALMRIKEDLEEMIIELAAWDRDPVPLAELLSSCVAPRRPSAGPEPAVTPPSVEPRQPGPSTGLQP